MSVDKVDQIARTLYFDWVDQHGYPNGLMTWPELPDTSSYAADMQCKATWLSLAESMGDAIKAEREALVRVQKAAEEILGYMDLTGEQGDLERNLRSALTALKEQSHDG